MSVLLEIKDLKVYFFTHLGIIKAVNDLTFTLQEKQTLGIVGESGSGKTLTALSILNLLPPKSKIVSGEIYFQRENILKKKEKEFQIKEVLVKHQNLNLKTAKDTAIDLLKKVKINCPEKNYFNYPYELSGGMCQRAMIAMAIACNPVLLIADEPTSSLDVTSQHQILELLKELKIQNNLSLILITHNLGIISKMADYLLIMYAGRMMEFGFTSGVLTRALNPYTLGLIKSSPALNQNQKRLFSIEGQVPDLINQNKGCIFSNRCPEVKEICYQNIPVLKLVENNHYVSCHLY
ncbi:MAG: ABC transporter ATP-binding protein [Armatimonadetes bacterium]|nr:ABC transporter ATP-binding protein [Armatimonadota bacterium]